MDWEAVVNDSGDEPEAEGAEAGPAAATLLLPAGAYPVPVESGGDVELAAAGDTKEDAGTDSVSFSPAVPVLVTGQIVVLTGMVLVTTVTDSAGQSVTSAAQEVMVVTSVLKTVDVE